MSPLPASALELLEAQFGVISRFQLLEWMKPDQVDSLLQRGGLIRLQRGVYRVAGGAVVDCQRPFAAALRARPGATLTGPAVLGHYRVDGFATDGPFTVLVQPDRRLSPVDFRWAEDPRPDREVTTCGEVRLALPEDALIDSVAWRAQLGDRTLKLGFDWLGWRGMIEREAFVADLARRRPTEPRAGELLELIGGERFARCESDGERRLGVLTAGFDPPPEPQVQVTPRRRADWYFRRLRLVLEYLGSVDHEGAVGRGADATRDEELAAAGIEVFAVRAEDLRDEPALLGRLVATVYRRASELGVPAPTFDPARV